MSKQYRSIIILVVVVAVLGGLYFALAGNTSPEESGVLYTPKKDEQLQSISITNQYGQLQFTTQNATWLVHSGQDAYRTNPEKMQLVTDALLHLPISRVLEEELPEYGLASPQATVQITTNKGKTMHIAIGAETASKTAVYIRDQDSGKIMLTTTSTAAQLTGSLAAYRSKDALTIDKANIAKLDYYIDDTLVVSVAKDGPQDWALTYPYAAPARQILLNELTGAMRTWSVAGYPDVGDTDYAAMGLDNPLQTMVVTDAAGNTQRLEFGKTDDNIMYVRIGAQHEIVKLYAVDVDFSFMLPDSLLFIAPLKNTIDEVAAISIDISGANITFTINHSTNPPVITIGDQPVDYNSFVSVFYKYLSMIADGKDDAVPPEAAQAEPVAVLTTTLLDGSKKELALLPRDETTLYMQLDGEIQYYTNAKNLSDLLYRLNATLGSETTT